MDEPRPDRIQDRLDKKEEADLERTHLGHRTGQEDAQSAGRPALSGCAITSAKIPAVIFPDTAAAATEAPRAASQRYPMTVKAQVTAQIAASTLPNAGFGAVADGRSNPRKNSPNPAPMTAICMMSRRVACSPRSSGASRRMNSGLVDCRKIALAAVVCLFACTYSSVVAAYAKPTTMVRQLQPRRASGSRMRIVSIASAARHAASCQAPKLHHLMAAPPLENSTAARIILDLGLMVAWNILPVMEVQIFGVKKSSDTRAALRFFAERRIKVHFVDLNERAAAVGELRRFAQKFGIQALVDSGSRRYAELGLRSGVLSEERWLEKLSIEPLVLRMPLVRYQQQLTIGAAPETWDAWYAAAKS